MSFGPTKGLLFWSSPICQSARRSGIQLLPKQLDAQFCLQKKKKNYEPDFCLPLTCTRGYAILRLIAQFRWPALNKLQSSKKRAEPSFPYFKVAPRSMIIVICSVYQREDGKHVGKNLKNIMQACATALSNRTKKEDAKQHSKYMDTCSLSR